MYKFFKLYLYAIGFLLVAVIFLSFVNCAKEENVSSADLVLLNGDIYTVDPDNPWAKSLVITGNTITAVCKNDKEARKFIGSKSRRMIS